jgi:hypothetical protein
MANYPVDPHTHPEQKLQPYYLYPDETEFGGASLIKVITPILLPESLSLYRKMNVSIVDGHKIEVIVFGEVIFNTTDTDDDAFVGVLNTILFKNLQTDYLHDTIFVYNENYTELVKNIINATFLDRTII